MTINSGYLCKRILIGGSAGSLDQLVTILEQCSGLELPPIIVAMHMSETSKDDHLKDLLQSCTSLKIRPAVDNIALMGNTVYLASGNYHILLTEDGQKMHLYDDEPYNFSKPSVDILFYSCIGSEAKTTKALLLSGANSDGAESFRALLEGGSECRAVSPKDCQFPTMPLAVAKLCSKKIFISLSSVASWIAQPHINWE